MPIDNRIGPNFGKPMTSKPTLYLKREGRSVADLGVLPNGADVWMVDEIVAAYVPVEPDLDILAETLSDFEPCETVEDRHYDQARHVLRVLGIGGDE